jgi:hypothetical protein
MSSISTRALLMVLLLGATFGIHRALTAPPGHARVRAGAHGGRYVATKLDRALQEGLDAGLTSFRVLVTPRPGAESSVRAALARLGTPVSASCESLHLVATRLDASSLRALARDPAIERISSDALVASSGSRTNSTVTGRHLLAGGPLLIPVTECRSGRVHPIWPSLTKRPTQGQTEVDVEPAH